MEITAIIVDDDEMCLLIHQHLIQTAGLHSIPLTFNSAPEALEYIVNQADNTPLLMFLDINMPVMNGWELLEILHKNGAKSQLYVIVVTSSIDAEDRKKAFSFHKVIDFVEKPFNEMALQKIISNLPKILGIGKEPVDKPGNHEQR